MSASIRTRRAVAGRSSSEQALPRRLEPSFHAFTRARREDGKGGTLARAPRSVWARRLFTGVCHDHAAWRGAFDKRVYKNGLFFFFSSSYFLTMRCDEREWEAKGKDYPSSSGGTRTRTLLYTWPISPRCLLPEIRTRAHTRAASIGRRSAGCTSVCFACNDETKYEKKIRHVAVKNSKIVKLAWGRGLHRSTEIGSSGTVKIVVSHICCFSFIPGSSTSSACTSRTGS